MIKKIDYLLVKSFIPPFIMAFFIALFVLVMQTLWVYIDEIIGKGISLLLLVELIGYMSISLFPMALPIGILIASVMVFGNLAERYELSSMKSAGISLMRVLRPLGVVCAVIAAFSFFCANYFIPVSQLKFRSRLYDIRRQKPTLSLDQGIFNDDFKGFTIRIAEKSEDGRDLKDILMYDHTQSHTGDLQLVMADRGEMYMSEDNNRFVMKLYDGHQYQELKSSNSSRYPFIRMDFDAYEKQFDLSEFEMNRTDEDRYKQHYSMLSVRQLAKAVEEFQIEEQEINRKNIEKIIPKYARKIAKQADPSRKRIKNKASPDIHKLQDINVPFIEAFPDSEQKRILRTMRGELNKYISNIRRDQIHINNFRVNKAKHEYELHIKFAAALMCIVFLFIGGPMGAIIRKGGYGYPLLITILFFMLYVVLSLSFKETMKVLAMNPVRAAWLPNFILLPVAIVLTWKAMNDSKFINLDRIAGKFRKLFGNKTDMDEISESIKE
jgi:lipopolysaccharide export system permease protein